MSQPLVDQGISTANIADIALEVLDVNGVEANDCGEETDIGFCDMGAREKVRCRRLCERFFKTVEGFEKLGHGFCVSILGATSH
jgi:hypothetical protein